MAAWPPPAHINTTQHEYKQIVSSDSHNAYYRIWCVRSALSTAHAWRTFGSTMYFWSFKRFSYVFGVWGVECTLA
eukprot:8094956-Pyramimonas_sp.AAC.1